MVYCGMFGVGQCTLFKGEPADILMIIAVSLTSRKSVHFTGPFPMEVYACFYLDLGHHRSYSCSLAKTSCQQTTIKFRFIHSRRARNKVCLFFQSLKAHQLSYILIWWTVHDHYKLCEDIYIWIFLFLCHKILHHFASWNTYRLLLYRIHRWR